MVEAEPRTALVAGGSGFVGDVLLGRLLDEPDFGRVVAVSRRPLAREHSRLANRIVQFDKLESQLKGSSCHVAFCCLGTTLREAGSEQVFRRVEVDYVLAFARAARAAKADRFVVLSAYGASDDARSLPLQLKGEMERGLVAAGFPSVDIFQPAQVVGLRRGATLTDLMALAITPLVNPFLVGPNEPRRAISVDDLAAGLLGASRAGRKGVGRYTWSNIRSLARAKPHRPNPPDAKAAARRR